MFERDIEKNEHLRSSRWVSFEDVVCMIEQWNIQYQWPHPNQKLYPHQYVFVVTIEGYPYMVPYVYTADKKAFLKTIYPCRKYK